MRHTPSKGPPWHLEAGSVHVRILGAGPKASAESLLESLQQGPAQLSWLRQIHSAEVLEACPGATGSGDALVTDRTDLGLAVTTADCVPVLLSDPTRIAAAHAGWRGLVGGVLTATVKALHPEGRSTRAWIGPAIGPCCYEVGDDVASRLVGASHPDVLVPGSGERPHVDLREVAHHQLAAAGVSRIDWMDVCTRCNPDWLASYRRDGEAAGRNLAVIWRDAS